MYKFVFVFPVSAEGTSQMLKGCASAKACSDKTIGILDLLDFSCCQGNYCNSASSTSAALLLLSVPLVSVGLFH